MFSKVKGVNQISQGEGIEWEEGLGQDPEENKSQARNKGREVHLEAEEDGEEGQPYMRK